MKHLFLFLLMVWAALGFCGCAVDASWQDGAVSGENESCPAARDLWIAGNNKLLDKTGIVYIKDANGTIMDAVVLNESPVEHGTAIRRILRKLRKVYVMRECGNRRSLLIRRQ